MSTLNVRENLRSSEEWTMQRHWQYWAHKTQDDDKQNKSLVLDNYCNDSVASRSANQGHCNKKMKN